MLTKNVYLLYRPGYSGSYINWAINVSDLDARENTVLDPINRKKSKKFGGQGTAHNHVRIPTHQTYPMLVNWLLLNRPQHPDVYIINAGGESRDTAIGNILLHDRNGICISVDNKQDWTIGAYGYINGVLKWPTRIVAEQINSGNSLSFDPFNCTKDINARNWFVSNESTRITGEASIDYRKVQKIVDSYSNWYQVRHEYQPHEVNNTTYIDSVDTTDRIFELSCLDVSTQNFIGIFEHIMLKGQISNNYDFSLVKDFHSQYCDAQENLHWFKSINQWLSTGELDSYILSHSVIEACVINYIFNNVKLFDYKHDNTEWVRYYNKIRGDNWPDSNSLWDFYRLPKHIQKELITDFGVIPKATKEHNLDELSKNWQQMSTIEINQWYQKYKNMLDS